MTDKLTVLGSDGIRRRFDEHYDTMMDVDQDPTGAMLAIHAQAARIEELEGQHNDLFDALELADAALSGSNMDMAVVERKTRASIAKARGDT